MKRLFVAVLPTVMLALVGCSGNPARSGPDSTPSSARSDDQGVRPSSV
jgi:hypothetical protein